jgi:23S rRNA (adenine2503-C2)-methyltransferase
VLRSIFDLSLEELGDTLGAWGEPPYRARQVWQGVYRRLAHDPAALTDLPEALRSHLTEAFAFQSMAVKATTRSQDGGTEKYLLALSDGLTIEAVLMRYERRRTACISTQAGCAMGCVFCATGQMGFHRNLTAGEIVEQAVLIARRLGGAGERLSNIVLMGMGEPFHNYAATMEAISRLNDSRGFNFGARRFTISTAGLVPMIERFTAESSQINLAISLHAATDELRSRLLPINRRYPLPDLMSACREYVDRTGRRISFEWALIEGLNDTLEQAEALAGLLEGLNCHVNLIPLNPTRKYAGEPTSRERAAAFRSVLAQRGIACTIRVRRGVDIQAGCGQLATEDKTASGLHLSPEADSGQTRD